jgi:hypothetical protein
MKHVDEFGMALCQSEYLGTQCDGHEDHGEVHFATVNDGAMTWTEAGVVGFVHDKDFINGRCCK